MKKYKYIGTIKQLEENGFEITESQYKDKPPLFAKRKTFDKENILVVLRDAKEHGMPYGYISDNFRNEKYDITPYIQDLIALGLVVEV